MSAKDWYEKDYYKILGVSKNAKSEDIKKAFRKIARDNHPDRFPGDKKREQRFKEASEANDVLSDKKKRAQYDQQRSLLGAFGGAKSARGGSAGFDQRVFNNFGGAGNLGDILGGLFGQASQGNFQMNFGSPAARPRKGNNRNGEITISFHDAINGCTVSMPIGSDQACTRCHGTGMKTGAQPVVCGACQGSGMKQGGDGVFTSVEPCDKCSGRGFANEDPCPLCLGTGRQKGNRNIQIRIPAGVENGEKLKIKGKGDAGSGGAPAGDLYVTVHVKPDSTFERKGADLLIKVPVLFAEAVLGAEITVPCMNSGQVKLRIPAGTPNGRTFRVRGKGVSVGGKTGDLLVSVEVVVPDSLTPQAKAALQEYAQIANEANPRKK